MSRQSFSLSPTLADPEPVSRLGFVQLLAFEARLGRVLAALAATPASLPVQFLLQTRLEALEALPDEGSQLVVSARLVLRLAHVKSAERVEAVISSKASGRLDLRGLSASDSSRVEVLLAAGNYLGLLCWTRILRHLSGLGLQVCCAPPLDTGRQPPALPGSNSREGFLGPYSGWLINLAKASTASEGVEGSTSKLAPVACPVDVLH